MTHSATCTLGETGRLSYDCDDCLVKKVGDMPPAWFEEVMGCSREQFERWCQTRYLELEDSGGMYDPDELPPTGLYNFWYAIMDFSAVKVQVRVSDLRRRLERTGRV